MKRSFLPAALAAAAAAVLMSGGFSVSADDTDFVTDITPCTRGENDGRLSLNLTGGKKSDTFYISTDGGKNYTELGSRKVAISGLSEGCVSVCIKNDKGSESPVSMFYIPEKKKKYPVMISAEVYPEDISADASVKVHIENYDKEKQYQISADGGIQWTDTAKPIINLVGMTAGNASVCVRIKDSDEMSPVFDIGIDPPVHGNKGFIGAEAVLQNPELPTGCEITSLTMLLNHIGFDVDKTVMADEYLPKGEYGKADFNEVFVGDPRNIHSFGCFSKPIVQAAEAYLRKYDNEGIWRVRNITGCGIDSLFAAIDRGNPAVVWASCNMGRIGKGRSWISETTGEKLVWPLNEHCLLLTGYDIEKQVVYFNDPMVGKTAYWLGDFEKVFTQLGSHAVIIVRRDEE